MTPIIFAIAIAVGTFQYIDASAAQSNKDVMLVQEHLIHYRARDPTGIPDSSTRSAIQAYQFDWNIPQTSDITPELIAMLTRRHALTRPQWYRVKNQNCAIWNPGPEPRAVATWSGQCASGRTSGTGQLVWTFIRYGRSIRYVYDGQRQDGKAAGHGQMNWHDGSYYVGSWANGKRHGHGSMAWANGELAGVRYTGSWKHDRPHGKGILIQSNGAREMREWTKGCSSKDGHKQAIETTIKACAFGSRK